MRRWLWGIMGLLCVGLWGGCARQAAAPADPVTVGFACRVEAEYNGLALTGRLERRIATSLTLTVEQPATLEGLALTWDGQSLTAQLHGLSAAVDEAALPPMGLLPGLLQALDAAASLTAGGTRTADGLTLSGDTEAGRFTLVSDPVTGNLLTLDIPAMPLTVTFSDFQALTA